MHLPVTLIIAALAAFVTYLTWLLAGLWPLPDWLPLVAGLTMLWLGARHLGPLLLRWLSAPKPQDNFAATIDELCSQIIRQA